MLVTVWGGGGLAESGTAGVARSGDVSPPDDSHGGKKKRNNLGAESSSGSASSNVQTRSKVFRANDDVDMSDDA